MNIGLPRTVDEATKVLKAAARAHGWSPKLQLHLFTACGYQKVGTRRKEFRSRIFIMIGAAERSDWRELDERNLARGLLLVVGVARIDRQ